MGLSLQADWEEQGLLIVELQEQLTIEHARRRKAEHVLRQILTYERANEKQLRRLAEQYFNEV